MKLLTALLFCLLALFGDPRPGVTSIIRASQDGVDTVFSKTTLEDGVATFECLAASGGACVYRLYQEQCEKAAGTRAGCQRVVLDEFELQVGRRRQVQGLPEDFRHCVAATGARDTCRA